MRHTKELLKRLRVTTSMIEGGYINISFSQLPRDENWSIIPLNVMCDTHEENVRVITTTHTDYCCIYSVISVADATFAKIIHSDCDQIWQIAKGKIIDLVTGTITGAGETYFCIAGQVHQVTMIQDTIMQVTLIKK